jgi:hypothetical protein
VYIRRTYYTYILSVYFTQNGEPRTNLISFSRGFSGVSHLQTGVETLPRSMENRKWKVVEPFNHIRLKPSHPGKRIGSATGSHCNSTETQKGPFGLARTSPPQPALSDYSPGRAITLLICIMFCLFYSPCGVRERLAKVSFIVTQDLAQPRG